MFVNIESFLLDEILQIVWSSDDFINGLDGFDIQQWSDYAKKKASVASKMCRERGELRNQARLLEKKLRIRRQHCRCGHFSVTFYYLTSLGKVYCAACFKAG